MSAFLRSLNRVERMNTIFYITGIMCYKFGLDAVMTSFDALIRHHAGMEIKNTAWASALIVNYVLTCLGSLMVTPLIRCFRIQHVLAFAVLCFGIIASIFPILSLIMGHEKISDKIVTETPDSTFMWIAIVLYAVTGLFQGLVELVRRIIPQMLVGNDNDRLKSLDSIVHIFYEVSGTLGPIAVFFVINQNGFSSIYSLIPFLCLSPVAFVLWLCLKIKNPISIESGGMSSNSKLTFFYEFAIVMKTFGISIVQGAKLVLRNRSLIWLIPAYSLPLVLHRYLEGIFLTQYAIATHGDKNLRLAFLSSSNFGELLGAAFTLLFVDLVKTPLPWLRLDAITLLFAWVFYSVPQVLKEEPGFLLTIVGMCALCTAVSFGWASGDVSLVAYIQSTLGDLETKTTRASPLGSVMAFLYACYVIIFAVISLPINLNADIINAGKKDPKGVLRVSSIVFTVSAVIIFLATFIPKKSFAFNPKSLKNNDIVKDKSMKPKEEEQQQDPDAPLK